MPVGIATRRAGKHEAVSDVTALIEGDDGRKGLGGHRLDGKGLRCFARALTLRLRGAALFAASLSKRLLGKPSLNEFHPPDPTSTDMHPGPLTSYCPELLVL